MDTIKPIIDISQLEITIKCNEAKDIDVSITLYAKGVYRICLDIPNEVPIFFKETETNSICKVGICKNEGDKFNHKFNIGFICHKKDNYSFMLGGTITDASGNSITDYCKINLNCL